MTTKSVLPHISEIIAYIEAEEKADYEANPTRNHIYYDIIRVKNWLREQQEKRSVISSTKTKGMTHAK